jgi:hypothetical protein
MNQDSTLHLFEAYIPSKQWRSIDKVSVKYKENKWLRWLALFNSNQHKRYYLKVTYKDQKIKFISIPHSVKDEIKSQVMTFNFHINALK